MSPTEIRIAIDEVCGQKWESHAAEWHGEKSAQWLMPQYWTCNGQQRPMLEAPDYPNDLNAMHEALRSLDQMQGRRYLPILLSIMGGSEHNTEFDLFRATARQRAEAFLRTLGKWKE